MDKFADIDVQAEQDFQESLFLASAVFKNWVGENFLIDCFVPVKPDLYMYKPGGDDPTNARKLVLQWAPNVAKEQIAVSIAVATQEMSKAKEILYQSGINKLAQAIV
eukprot:3796962-Alexandrium_andersonii.AAC.1